MFNICLYFLCIREKSVCGGGGGFNNYDFENDFTPRQNKDSDTVKMVRL